MQTSIVEGNQIMGIAYTVERAAEAASIPEQEVTAAISEGRLPIRRVGDATIILRTDIINWLESIPPY